MQAAPSPRVNVSGILPAGVSARALPLLADFRGSLVEVFRQTWVAAPNPPLQWNIVTSGPGVMRGMHVHLGYHEYYVVMQGRTTIGYRDTRPGSPTEHTTALVEVSAGEDALAAVSAPPGIVHGIYTHEPTILLTAMTRYWDLAQELGCHWRDPALGIAWPFEAAQASERDEALPPLADIQHLVPPYSV
jgi:dTDP-4-dehydrorhamnose 3,5-epimerase